MLSEVLGALFGQKESGVEVSEFERKDTLTSTMGMGHLILFLTNGLATWLEWQKLKQFYIYNSKSKTFYMKGKKNLAKKAN